MPRPRSRKRICFSPNVCYFKPRGVPLKKLEVVKLELEEVQALKLKNIEDFDQKECARKMNTSQSTFQRILSSAYEKLSRAVVEGKAIQVEK